MDEGAERQVPRQSRIHPRGEVQVLRAEVSEGALRRDENILRLGTERRKTG